MRMWSTSVGGGAHAVLKSVLMLGVVVLGGLLAGCGDGVATDQATERDNGSDATTPTTEPAPEEACKMPADVERVSELRASTGVDCEKAAEVATAYDAAVLGGGEFPDNDSVPAAGFSCRASQKGTASEETSTVACTGSGGTVDFVWGV